MGIVFVTNVAADEETPLPMPAMNFTEDHRGKKSDDTTVDRSGQAPVGSSDDNVLPLPAMNFEDHRHGR